MKILHVITGMRKAAGTTTFVENVVQGLQLAGHDVEVVMSTSGLKKCDIIHIHGLWGWLLHKAALFAKKNGIPVVWSTHGMTAPWAMHHKWWKKLPAWLLYQRWDLKSAAALHCTTELEVEWNKTLGFRDCFIVPLGTHLLQSFSQTPIHDSNSTLLFVGRIYPVKGLENLIHAWGKVVRRLETKIKNENWKLRIVGPDQAGHRSELEHIVEELGLSETVKFVGAKYGEDLDREYDNCQCLVLPSFTENFGGVIVDAMSHGKPCIASTFTPWKELRERECGWWVSNEAEVLAAAICEMITLDETRRCEMGRRGRELVEKKYTWDVVVKAMENGYSEVLK